MILGRLHVLLPTACLLFLWPAWSASQPQKTDEILALATRFMEDFVGRLSNVVAEEHYHQEASHPMRRRELRSDFLLVRPTGSTGWFQFRDVFEVDGKPVRERQERLTELFLAPSPNALARAGEVARESARYNLINIGTLNTPLTAISFLQPSYQPRFRFSGGSIDRKVGPDARVIQYEEWARPTILGNGRGDRNVRARGHLWIDGSTGRVLKTELLIDARRFPDEIVTSFEFNRDLQIGVPVEMRERYEVDDVVMTGIATYSQFRRYQVFTDERVR